MICNDKDSIHPWYRMSGVEPKVKLFEAISQGDLDFIKKRIQEGSDINQKISLPEHKIFGWTSLHIAVSAEKREALSLLISLGAKVDAQEDKEDLTPLHMAVAKNQIEIVQLLVNAKANVDIQQLDGDTALILAATEGYLQIVKILLEANADTHLKDNLGWTALIWAATNGQTEVIKLLVSEKLKVHEGENESDRTALLIAASVGNTEIAKLLIHEGYDFGIPGFQKALMAAATNGHFEIVEILRKHNLR